MAPFPWIVKGLSTWGERRAYDGTVGEQGRVRYLTEGLLRALHRRESDREPRLASFVPHHSFLRDDAMELMPGEVAELRSLTPAPGTSRRSRPRR